MRIEIWSDVVCPWCYIGKRRFESALGRVSTGLDHRSEGPEGVLGRVSAGLDHRSEGPEGAVGRVSTGLDHRDEVEVVYRSFQLDPAAPRVPDQTVAEHLGSKYGGGADAGRQMVDRVEAVAAEEGLVFRLGEAQRANTADAHRLLHLALEDGGPALQGALEEELLAAYFLRAENVADHATLRRTAAGVGLDASHVERVLASQEYADAVERDIRDAAALGATGVPFFVVDRKYGISGAQPVDLFVQVLERARAEGHRGLSACADRGF